MNTDSKMKHIEVPDLILHAMLISSGIIISLTYRNIPFGIVMVLFTISYASNVIKTLKNKKMTNCVREKNSDGDIFKNYLTELENHLNTSVRNKLDVIPVLTEQLKAVISQTDDAAGTLTEGFMGISRQAKKQLQSVQGLFGNLSEKTSDTNILFQTQENLREIQSNFDMLASFFDNSIKMITEVMEQLHKVDTFAKQINKIGKTTNILALNASIEATHTGEAGRGFQVIASEINILSKDSNNSIKEITEITENLASKVTAIKHELETVHQHSSSIGMRTDELFNLTISKIESTLQNAAERVKTVAGDAEALSKEINKIVVSIQFQDITRQRIEHVINPLLALNKEIIDTIDKLIKKEIDFSQANTSGSTDMLLQQYTMESERELLKKVTSRLSK